MPSWWKISKRSFSARSPSKPSLRSRFYYHIKADGTPVRFFVPFSLVQRLLQEAYPAAAETATQRKLCQSWHAQCSALGLEFNPITDLCSNTHPHESGAVLPSRQWLPSPHSHSASAKSVLRMLHPPHRLLLLRHRLLLRPLPPQNRLPLQRLQPPRLLPKRPQVLRWNSSPPTIFG